MSDECSGQEHKSFLKFSLGASVQVHFIVLFAKKCLEAKYFVKSVTFVSSRLVSKLPQGLNIDTSLEPTRRRRRRRRCRRRRCRTPAAPIKSILTSLVISIKN